MSARHAALACALSALTACDGAPAASHDSSTPELDAGVHGDSGSGEDAGRRPDGSAGSDAGRDAGPPTPVPRVEVRLDRPIVERDNEQLVELTVTCIPRDEDGLVMADPGDLVASVSATDAAQTSPFVFTFPARGAYTVSCRSDALGLGGEERVEVAYEGLDRDVIRLAERSASAQAAIDRGLAAARAGDEGTVRAAGAELAAVASGIDLDRYAPLTALVPFPPGWPTAAQARAAGLGRGADDAAWSGALADVASTLADLETATAALPRTGELTPADGATYEAALDAVIVAIRRVEGLDPSAAATLEHMPELNAVVSSALPRAMRAQADYLGEAYATAAVPAPSPGSLTFVGALVSIAVKSIVAEYSYGALLKKVGAVIRENMIALALADLIDELIPPDAGAPVIDSAHGSAGGFLTPGNPWAALGSGWGSPRPSDYVVVFVHPNIPGLLSDVLGLFTSAAGVLDGDHWVQIAKNVYDIIRSTIDIAERSYSIADPDRVLLVPTGIIDDGAGGHIVEFPSLPTGVNCSFLPRVGTLIPVRYGVGRGPSHMTNVIQEGC